MKKFFLVFLTIFVCTSGIFVAPKKEKIPEVSTYDTKGSM